MHPQFDLPSRGTIKGRSSSITAAFVQAVTPVVIPSDEEVEEALGILGMSHTRCVCAYCGDAKTEWDHFRTIVDQERPTDFITEIPNLVPACGKCNQSKGSKHWKSWMPGTAARVPAKRNVPGLEEKVARLERFDSWRVPTRLNYEQIVGEELWQEYMRYWQALLQTITSAQQHADELRQRIEAKLAGEPAKDAVRPSVSAATDHTCLVSNTGRKIADH